MRRGVKYMKDFWELQETHQLLSLFLLCRWLCVSWRVCHGTMRNCVRMCVANVNSPSIRHALNRYEGFEEFLPFDYPISPFARFHASSRMSERHQCHCHICRSNHLLSSPKPILSHFLICFSNYLHNHLYTHFHCSFSIYSVLSNALTSLTKEVINAEWKNTNGRMAKIAKRSAFTGKEPLSNVFSWRCTRACSRVNCDNVRKSIT